MNKLTNDGRWQRLTEVHIAGVHFHHFKGRLGDLKYGTVLRLVAEPENPHDPNAIRIETDDNGMPCKVGYIPRHTPGVAPLLKLGYPMVAIVDAVDAKANMAIVEIAVRKWGDNP